MNSGPTIKFKKLHERAIVPRAWNVESVGFDLHAFIVSENDRPSKKLVPPRTVISIPTQIAIEVPKGYFGAVCSRSGLGALGCFVANAPGIIDPDYRGEIKVLFYNGGLINYYVEHDQRIAQLVLLPAVHAIAVEVQKLSESERGDKGFGSTGQ